MYGEILKEAPKGFVPREQWPEYQLACDCPPFLGPRVVGKNPVGMYRRFWPIVVEEYISDKEPMIEDSDPMGISLNRVLIWQRLFNTDIPAGWHQFSKKTTRLEGVAELGPGKEYWKQWSESARRYRKKWHTETTYGIEKVTYEDFESAYMHSSVAKVVKHLLLDSIKRKLNSPVAHHIELWCVRDISTHLLVAGMATLSSPTYRGSYYISGFFTDMAPDSAMVGLMDNWFARSEERGIRFLHFGGFWMKGTPDNWKGFSQFKAKFGLQYFICPPPLFRFKGGRLF